MLWGDVYDGGSSERRRRRYCHLPLLLGGCCTDSVLTRHVQGPLRMGGWVPPEGSLSCVRGHDQNLHTVGIKIVGGWIVQ